MLTYNWVINYIFTSGNGMDGNLQKTGGFGLSGLMHGQLVLLLVDIKTTRWAPKSPVIEAEVFNPSKSPVVLTTANAHLFKASYRGNKKS